MGSKDIISKEVIKRIAVDLATILLELDIDPESLELLATETQRIEERRADLVARVQDARTRESYLLHIEIQNHNDVKMPLRMLRYYTDIRLSWPKEPLHQYLIYIGKDRLSMPAGIDEPGHRYRYRILDMRQIDCDALLNQDTPDALVLAILCDFKNRPAKDVVHYILTRLKILLKDDESGFRRYIDMLEILSENRALQETIKEVEQMLTQVDIQKLPSYQLGMEQGLEKGREEGMEKGMEKGM
ncbi:MAG: Rpn family recombination-promoting nuclease/putative transposase, partial [Gammaproteobacteria bacterium]|nr:Rpn family recombination-promoting nuclease/putative transposase [Gammaproteobacteria bacterium]